MRNFNETRDHLITLKANLKNYQKEFDKLKEDIDEMDLGTKNINEIEDNLIHMRKELEKLTKKVEDILDGIE